MDEALHPWCEALWPQIESVLGRKLRPPPPADAIPAPRYTLTPIVETSQRDDVDFSSVARGAATPCTGPEAGRFAGTGAPAGADQPPSAHNPWSARVLVNIRITREGQPREVRLHCGHTTLEHSFKSPPFSRTRAACQSRCVAEASSLRSSHTPLPRYAPIMALNLPAFAGTPSRGGPRWFPCCSPTRRRSGRAPTQRSRGHQGVA